MSKKITEVKQNSMTRLILSLAIPNIISNISVPLLSMADTAIAGRMSTTQALGAVALASLVANFSYWLWGFLRMTTTGFTAQAYGRDDKRAITRQLCVGITIALMGAIIILLARPLLYKFSHLLSVGAEELGPDSIAYLRVAYWGAPAALLLYVFNGWFVGIQNTTIPMFTAIISNIINIGLSFALVWHWHLGVEGIAWGTVIAQYTAVTILVFFALFRHGKYFEQWQWRDFFSLGEFFSYIHIAKYLLVRTLMLGSISLYFIRAGSSYGSTTVGANALLMQFFSIFSYFMDGFAYSGEALSGRFIGEENWTKLKEMIRKLFGIGWIMAPTMSLIFYFFSHELLSILSDKADIIALAQEHILWILVIPIASFSAFLWDGIFVGATTSKPMSQAVSIAWVTFFVCYLSLRATLGVDALWLAFVLYLSIRSLLSAYWGYKLVKRITA